MVLALPRTWLLSGVEAAQLCPISRDFLQSLLFPPKLISVCSLWGSPRDLGTLFLTAEGRLQQGLTSWEKLYPLLLSDTPESTSQSKLSPGRPMLHRKRHPGMNRTPWPALSPANYQARPGRGSHVIREMDPQEKYFLKCSEKFLKTTKEALFC